MQTPSPSVPIPALCLVAVALGLGACTGTDQRPTTLGVRDSAGIRLTAARTPESRDTAAWQVDHVVGTLEGGQEYPFDGVAGIVLRPDGSLVVADGGARRLLFFDADGRLTRAVGQSGRGPGEFAGEIELLPYRWDSLMVWEFGRRQLTIFDREGQLGRTLAISTAEPNPFLAGAWADGSLLFGSRHLRLAPGTNADSVTLNRVAPDGRAFPVQGWFRTGIVHFQMTATGPVVDNHPFMPSGSMAVAEGGFVVASGDAAVLQEIDPAGRLVARHHWELETARLDPAAVAAWKRQDLLGQRDDAARAVRQSWLDDLELPAQAPANSALRIGTDGARWVQRFALGSRVTRYDRLDPDGRWLEVVTIPADFDLWAATVDMAVGVRRDGEGVERVVAYRRPVR